MKRGNVSAVWMVCTACGGKDENCKECDGWGKQKLTTCPREIPDVQTWRVIQMAEFAEKGTWPLAGGLLDQSQTFTDACRAAWHEEAYWRRQNSI